MKCVEKQKVNKTREKTENNLLSEWTRALSDKCDATPDRSTSEAATPAAAAQEKQ